MIKLTRINGTELLVNEDFIEIVEQTPDTVVTMQNGHRYLVQDTVDDILERSARFRRESFPIEQKIRREPLSYIE